MPALTDEVETLIAKIGDDWAAHWNAGELEQLVGMYADDAVYMPPHHAAVHGREAIHEYLKGPLRHGVRDLDYELTFIKHSGDLAYDVGRFTMTIPQPDGTRRQDRGKYLTVWRRQPGGQWRIVADCWSSDLPPAR